MFSEFKKWCSTVFFNAGVEIQILEWNLFFLKCDGFECWIISNDIEIADFPATFPSSTRHILLSSVTGFPVDSLDSVWGAFPPSAEQCWLHYFWLYGGNRHFVLAVFDNASHLQPFRYLDRLAHIELFRSSVMLLFFCFDMLNDFEWFRHCWFSSYVFIFYAS